MTQPPAVKLILTHDNADFDAVAAMLAAYKLDPSALPVLPMRVNRNVEQFLTLYAGALPFFPRDELKRGGPVERVTVVDTQGFATARGMRPTTPVHFIDHHPLQRALEENQTFAGDATGATTTLLVEQIQAQNLRLAPLEATLLLLGIYEDTGSLLYGTTTPRDVRCAAWLLEQGAELDVAREFLQHRLLPDQRALYEQLIEHAETHIVNGHAVLLATAVATQPVDEIATLAHKLRELYEPSAVFVLVGLNGDIQLVARGASDAIDVSRVAVHFGGGGHGRAAAALVRGWTLPAARQEILDLLPRIVRASVQVESLMSRGAQTVRATERVKTAYERMQRTGHEGFPVVEGGRVVGLIARRAVDRAMQHGLGGQPVRAVMDAGEVTVTPTDSIEILQQRMMRSGWGQIPVVDAEGRLIGIVTRTDLIKRWGQRPDVGRREDTVCRMEAAMPPGLWRLLQAVAAEAQQQGMGLYLVGGFVRDLLLGQPNHDVDLVVEGSAIHLVAALQAAFGGDMRSHEQFGTAKWLLGAEAARALGVDPAAPGLPASVDFVSARTEFYEQPTVLPTVEPSSIKQDLYRRDFTINTLAIRLAPGPFGELLDFYGGEQDLRDRLIRVLHSLSFVDDPTRMLRAVRLEQRLGFAIEPRTEELIRSALPLLDRVSGDRLRHELALLLAEPEPLRAMERLDQLGILAAIHPGLRVDDWVRAALYALHYARRNPPWASLRAFDNWVLTAFGLFTGRLGEEELEQLARRLQFKRAYLNHLQDARAVIALLPELAEPLSPHDVVRRLETRGEVGWLAGWAAASNMTARNQIARFAQEWRFVRPALDGRELAALTGLKPGPVFGALLARLRQAWLNSEIATPQEEHALLRELVANPTRLQRLLENAEQRGTPD